MSRLVCSPARNVCRPSIKCFVFGPFFVHRCPFWVPSRWLSVSTPTLFTLSTMRCLHEFCPLTCDCQKSQQPQKLQTNQNERMVHAMLNVIISCIRFAHRSVVATMQKKEEIYDVRKYCDFFRVVNKRNKWGEFGVETRATHARGLKMKTEEKWLQNKGWEENRK